MFHTNRTNLHKFQRTIADVRISKPVGRFTLKKNFVPDNEIGVIEMRQNYSLVDDLIVLLPRKRNLRTTQFYNECIFVDDFVVAFAQFALNFHAKANQLENFFLEQQVIHLLFISCKFVKFVSSLPTPPNSFYTNFTILLIFQRTIAVMLIMKLLVRLGL